MKQLQLLLLLFLLLQLPTRAQDQGFTHMGFRAGYNYGFSSYKAPDKLPGKPVHGGYAGVQLKIPFDNHLFFAPQMDVNYRGMTLKQPAANEYSKITEFQLRLAPLLQVDFGTPDKNTYFLQFGPSIGFGIKGKQTRQDGNNNPLQKNLTYGYQAYGRYDASAHLGLGYETAAGFRLLAEYVHGISNMINTEFGPNLKYSSISLGIGFRLK
jgi:hypothetical protein